MKIDPNTQWPFFVHHGTRRTTWDDPRYSSHYDPRSDLTLGRGFSDNSYQGGVFTPGWYPEMFNNPLSGSNKHLDNLNNTVDAGDLHPRSATSTGPGQISQQRVVSNNSQVAMVNSSQSTQHVQMDYNLASRQQQQPADLSKNSNVVINPEITMGPVNKTFNTSEPDIHGQTHGGIRNSTIESVVTKPDIFSEVVATSPSTNVKDFSQPEVLSNVAATSSPEIVKISEIAQKSLDLEQRLLSFRGPRGSKEYIVIEESLMTLLLLLDKIETHGDVDVRKARKSTVCRIQQLLSNLEEKATRY